MDLPKASAPLMARGTKLWVQGLPWPAIPFHHVGFVGSVVHLVLYKAPLSIRFPTDNLEGGIFPSITSGDPEVKGREGHLANPCEQRDRNSDSRYSTGVLPCFFLAPPPWVPPCFFLSLPPWPPLASQAQWRTGINRPKPPCQEHLWCSAEEQNPGYPEKPNDHPQSTWMKGTKKVLSWHVGGAQSLQPERPSFEP